MSIKAATHILAEAGVRYWEDAYVNDIEDTDGTLIPGRDGDVWRVKIELATGKIEGWPEGTAADIHYKVCDAGQYWLLDAEGRKVAYRDGYVPGSFLCHGYEGYGDYIIMTIGPDGQIAYYTQPEIICAEWKAAFFSSQPPAGEKIRSDQGDAKGPVSATGSPPVDTGPTNPADAMIATPSQARQP